MIEQHYYTRDRKGLFSNTPGYDTVAKSKNLDNSFIKNYLNDLCFYDVPSALAGEEDILKYPKALFCVNTDDNKMIIGQSSFAGKDYTGVRNRYFTHSYIISEEKELYIKNPSKIIHSNGFVSNYDIDSGQIIPAISEIEQEKSKEEYESINHMFNKIGMDCEKFKQLIIAAFHAAKFGKKIYIVLNCDESDILNKSKSVLEYIYRAAPFEIRRRLSFITYMKEPKNKSLINLIFLTKGSIKRLTTEIKAGYVFDFADNNFYLEDMEENIHSFIEFVMENIDNRDILYKFFSKMDKLQLKDKLDIDEYDSIINFVNSQEINFYDEHMEEKYKEFCMKKNKKVHIGKEDNSVIEKDMPRDKGFKNFLNKIKDRFF